MTIRKNYVRLDDDSGKWRSTEQRFGKLSFGIMKFRLFDDSAMW